MRKFSIKFIVLFSIELVCLSAAFGQTNVSGNITTNTTWTIAGSPYTLTGNVTVLSGQTLTIQPGVTVNFPYSNAISQLIVKGTLNAVGTAVDSIKFTGGATSTCCSNTQRGPVIIDTTSVSSMLQYISVNQLGYYSESDYTASIIIRSSSCTVSNCRIRNIQGTAIWLANASPTISNNSFSGNSNMDVILGVSRLPQLTGNNAMKVGIISETMTADAVFTSGNTYYRLLANLTVPSGKTLTIQPGVQVDFPYSNAISQLIVKGTLNAVGTSVDSIKFTGGATSTCCSNTQRGPVIIDTTSVSSMLQYISVNQLGYYSESDYTASIIIRSSSCTVSNCRIRNIQGTAIWLANASPTISNNSFSGNANMDVILGVSRLPQLTGNNAMKVGILSETMTADAVFTSGNTYYRLLANLTVPSGKTLTIQPGVQVDFPYSNAISQLIVKGTLNAVGTSVDSIKFTGGATSTCCSNTQRGPVIIDTTSVSSMLQYISVNQLGYYSESDYTASIIIRSSSCTVSNCRIRNIQGTAIWLANASPTISNNSFSGNSNMDVILGVSRLPQLTGNNAMKVGIISETMTADAVFTSGNTYYRLLANLTVPSGKTLTIQPGVQVDFPYSNAISQLIVKGTLNAVGTSVDSIKFTGGATSTCCSNTQRGPVIIDTTSVSSMLQYISVNQLGYYSESDYTASIIIRSSSCTVSNCRIRNIQGTAIWLANASPTISNNSFSGNANMDVILGVSRLPQLTGNNAMKVGILSETMTADAVFTSGNTYYRLLANLTVPSGKTLTIQPGVQVDFPYSNAISQLIVKGTLNAVGTSVDSIKFTGGATSTCCSNTQRGPVIIDTTSVSSMLQYISVNQLGYFNNTINTPSIIVKSTSCSINNCNVRNIKGSGISIQNSVSPTIQNNSFSGNINGDIVSTAMTLANVNDNTNASVYVSAGTVDQNSLWPNPGTNSRYVLSGIITINPSFNLNIAAGTIVDFNNNNGNMVVKGSLTAIGTSASRIQFVKQAPGTPFGGTLSFDSTSTGSSLIYVNTDRLGSITSPAKSAAIELNTASISIANVSIANSESNGLVLKKGNPTITQSNFLNNKTGVLSTVGNPVFTQCGFSGNTNFAINNTSGVVTDTVDARNNWWGAPSGPKHPTNPSGTGDSVSNKVKFIPFSTQIIASIIPDIGISAMIAPVTSCSLGSSETVTVTITNYGNTVYTGFPVSYRINNGVSITDSVITSLLPGLSLNYSFIENADLSTPGAYQIKAYTSASADSNHVNDTLTTTVQNLSTLSNPINLLPVNGSTNLDIPVSFSWSTVIGATSYDLFLWDTTDNTPSIPLATNLTQTFYNYSGSLLQYGANYKWKVAAKFNSCKRESAVQHFQIKDLPDLIVKNITAPVLALSGQQISVAWQVKDSSGTGTGNIPWLDHIWLSVDTILQDNPPASDFYLGGVPNLTALLPGESYINSAGFTLPNGIGGGYHIIVKSNALGTQSPVISLVEKDVTNNTSVSDPFQINLAPSPDLNVTSIILPVNAFSGTTVNINWTVKNLGADIISSSAHWTDKVYISLSSSFNLATATFLGQYVHTGNLSEDSSYTQSASITIPNYIYGLYFIYILTDANNQVYEIPYENNNTASDVINVYLTPPPDLAVQNFTIPATGGSGSAVTLSWVVRNAGATPTDNSWIDKVFITTNANYDLTNAITIGTVNSQGILNADSSYTRQFTATIPGNFNGSYFLYILTNAGNSLFENGSVQNNVLRSDTSIQIRSADLSVQNFIVPASASNGFPITLSATIKNTGSFTATNGWADKIYISQNGNYDLTGAAAVGSINYSQNLNVGDSYTIQPNVAITGNYNGAYYLYIRTNANNNLFENGSLQNNILRSDTTIQINTADLTVDTISVPATANSGQSISISWRVNNQGNGDIFNASRVDSIYLSTQSSFNSLAIRVNALSSVESITSGSGIIKQTSLSVPNGISGNYYLYVFTDSRNFIYENNNENNNIGRSINPVNITLSPPADLSVQNIQVPDSAHAGFKMPFSFTVTNSGTAAASGTNWTDKVYISPYPVWQANNASLIGSYTRSQPLTAAANYVITDSLLIKVATNGTLTVNGHLLDSAYGYFYVFTDANNQVYEYNTENNNILASDSVYIIPPRIDLEVTRVSSDDSAYSGQSAHAYWKVRNNGVSTAYKGNEVPCYWYDGIYLSRDTVWDNSDVFVFDWGYSNTPHDSSYHDSRNFIIPNGSSGDYYLLLVADHKYNLHEDVKRSNNYKLIRDSTGHLEIFHVTLSPSPDLIVTQALSPVESNAGQPVKAKWSVKNNGTGTVAINGWEDAVFLSSDFNLDANDRLLGFKAHTGSLLPGQSYNDSMDVVLPLNVSGNFVLIYKTDYHNNVYEHLNENNNISFSIINITLPPPSDLVVTAVNLPLTGIAGEMVSIDYTIKNAGVNAAAGIMSDGIYLSLDTAWDISDQLIGTVVGLVNILPDAQLTRNLTAKITGAGMGYYKAIVKTDLLNNIVESNDANNNKTSTDSIHITVKQLPLAVLTPDSLFNNTYLYYRIEIPDSLANQTLLLSLKGDSLNANNELYAKLGSVPSRAVYDFNHGTGIGANQELLIPSLQSGTYYIAVYGNNTVANKQSITLYATILPFAVRSVQANQGGNSGSVTVQINGSKFEPNMQVKLRNTSGTTITASNVYYTSTTKIFASFDLLNKQLGFYDLIVRKPDTSQAILTNGFQIIAGTGGGFYVSGDNGTAGPGCDPNAANGLNALVQVGAQYPANTRRNRVIAITIFFGNSGNVDIPVPTRFIYSTGGAPLSFDVNGLSLNNQDLYMEFKETNGPPNILRPGATGSITIYTKAVAPLTFTVSD